MLSMFCLICNILYIHEISFFIWGIF
jgi:hypothetical protein